MNPERYSDPDEFRPERFEGFPLSSSEYMHQHGAARDHFTFGAGRRSVCPSLLHMVSVCDQERANGVAII